MKKGDYILATKWHDGDPYDHWCVGWYDRQDRDRHFVVDANGNQYRMNGFRRVAKISAARGKFILENVTYTNGIPINTRSLWWWKRAVMKSVDKEG